MAARIPPVCFLVDLCAQTVMRAWTQLVLEVSEFVDAVFANIDPTSPTGAGAEERAPQTNRFLSGERNGLFLCHLATIPLDGWSGARMPGDAASQPVGSLGLDYPAADTMWSDGAGRERVCANCGWRRMSEDEVLDKVLDEGEFMREKSARRGGLGLDWCWSWLFSTVPV